MYFPDVNKTRVCSLGLLLYVPPFARVIPLLAGAMGALHGVLCIGWLLHIGRCTWIFQLDP